MTVTIYSWRAWGGWGMGVTSIVIQSGSWIRNGPVNVKGNGIMSARGLENGGIARGRRNIRHENRRKIERNCAQRIRME